MPKSEIKGKNQSLLTEPINRLIPVMAVPTIVAQMITIIYNLVDTFFVSSLGTNATAAVGVNSSLEQTITLAGSLIGTGACSYISRLLGAKKNKEADEIFSTALISGVLIGVAVILIGAWNISGIVNLLGATPECREYSIQYARYVIYAAPFMICSLIMNMCLRSEGSAVYAMVGIGFGGVLNCLLDPLFIFGLNLGISGASISTCISKMVSCVILIFPYLRKRAHVELSLKNVHYTVQGVTEVLKIGSTSFFRQALSVVANTVMNRIAGGFSTSALAAISVSNRIMQFPFGVILGFGQGYQPVVGYNWGAKRFDRVKEAFRFSSVISVVGSAVMCVVIFIFAKPLIGIFTEADSEMLQIGSICVRMQCVVLPIHAWVSVINMFYAGIGRARNAILLSTSRQGYLYIPALLILPRLFGTYGLASCQAAADLASLFIALPMAHAAIRLMDGKEDKT
ncbi:MAG: MATE family efflux transporter [Lachnospiraceae bacterium]|nr:MATE family efflux transporter [Lachnospiraceae bacterium]